MQMSVSKDKGLDKISKEALQMLTKITSFVHRPGIPTFQSLRALSEREWENYEEWEEALKEVSHCHTQVLCSRSTCPVEPCSLEPRLTHCMPTPHMDDIDTDDEDFALALALADLDLEQLQTGLNNQGTLVDTSSSPRLPLSLFSVLLFGP